MFKYTQLYMQVKACMVMHKWTQVLYREECMWAHAPAHTDLEEAGVLGNSALAHTLVRYLLRLAQDQAAQASGSSALLFICLSPVAGAVDRCQNQSVTSSPVATQSCTGWGCGDA